MSYPSNTSSSTATTDYRSPAVTHSATSGDPTHQHHHHHNHQQQQSQQGASSTYGQTGAGDTRGTDQVVKTGNYQTGIEPGLVGSGAVPVVGDSYQNRMSGIATNPGAAGPGLMTGPPQHTVAGSGNGDGLVVNNGLGGPLGGSVVLGGQCECTRNGGSCQHGAGKCICRGCTTRATTVNPGINVGVSTSQYTAPVGTSGIGGGVADHGVGISGIVNTKNASGATVNATDANCQCVRNGGVCNCPSGNCSCTNCGAKRSSMQHTSAASGTGTHHHQQHHHHHAGAAAGTAADRHNIDGHPTGGKPLGGSEYVSHNIPADSHYKSSQSNMPVDTQSGARSPITDNSNYPYPAKDFTAAHPVEQGKPDSTANKPTNTSGVV